MTPKSPIETQGLTGGAAIALTGGTSSSPLPASENGTPPMLLAAPHAGQDWTQAARDAFQRMDQVLSENSESLNSAIKNIDTFAAPWRGTPTRSTASWRGSSA